jgi:hypothetical protein
LLMRMVVNSLILPSPSMVRALHHSHMSRTPRDSQLEVQWHKYKLLSNGMQGTKIAQVRASDDVRVAYGLIARMNASPQPTPIRASSSASC